VLELSLCKEERAQICKNCLDKCVALLFLCIVSINTFVRQSGSSILAHSLRRNTRCSALFIVTCIYLRDKHCVSQSCFSPLYNISMSKVCAITTHCSTLVLVLTNQKVATALKAVRVYRTYLCLVTSMSRLKCATPDTICSTSC
jgi:hypothetical protein